jgi:DNA adenine methylase
MNKTNTIQGSLNEGSQNNVGNRSPCPFVKWAGGKRCIINQLRENLPEDFNDYYEPFVGGGALFFEIHKQLDRAYLSDTNFDLIITYRMIQKKPEELIELLKVHQKNHSKDYYYQIRDLRDQKEPIEIASRFIYLNKTCYNGVSRDNNKGHFTVPLGRYTTPNIDQADNILACSEALSCAELVCTEFDTIKPNRNDFVYFDPPYHPTDEASFTSFTKYTKLDFTEKDQGRLRDFAVRLQKAGVLVLLSNSNALFIRDLYNVKPFITLTVHAPRFVNCKADRRDPVEEALIRSY